MHFFLFNSLIQHDKLTSIFWDGCCVILAEIYVADMYFLPQVLSMRLEEMSHISPIPSEAYVALWECIVRITNCTLLEGFAGARRCTNEGRSLMQLDYQVRDIIEQ